MFLEAFKDAFFDSLNIIPFLFIIFLLIEIFEHYYSGKILSFAKFSNAFKTKAGPLIGAILASVPQCGLSVIASAVYAKRLITRGTLIAVYIATSDEAIPVLIANPNGGRAILPLILVKIFVGIIAGYLVDIVFRAKETLKMGTVEEIELEKGCHSHDISKENIHNDSKKDAFGVKSFWGSRFGALVSKIKVLILHPFVHTLSVAFFVFIVTFIINLFFIAANSFAGAVNTGYNGIFEGALAAGGGFMALKEFFSIVACAVFGIIPNCAVSVGLTIMYLKGGISFAACAAGLSSGAGLGILVLIKKNEDKKDTAFIIGLLLILSIFAGILSACAKLFIKPFVGV